MPSEPHWRHGLHILERRLRWQHSSIWAEAEDRLKYVTQWLVRLGLIQEAVPPTDSHIWVSTGKPSPLAKASLRHVTANIGVQWREHGLTLEGSS